MFSGGKEVYLNLTNKRSTSTTLTKIFNLNSFEKISRQQIIKQCCLYFYQQRREDRQ